MNIIYLNGEFIPQEQATISIMDRGFLFADSIYEVIPIFDGKMLGVDEHLARLDRSLNAINIKPPLSAAQWKQVFHDLLEKNATGNSSLNIYLQITRGTDTTRNHAIPTNLQPTFLAFCTPAKAKNAEQLQQGFKAITLTDTRRLECYIKSTALLANVLLFEQAQKAGAVEAILIRDGYVTEGTSSNLFIVSNSEIFTPQLTPMILGGVTRDLLLQLAKKDQIPTHETAISESMLLSADEIWVTGSSKEIVPITQLNDNQVGNGQAGPLWQRIQALYHDYKNRLI